MFINIGNRNVLQILSSICWGLTASMQPDSKVTTAFKQLRHNTVIIKVIAKNVTCHTVYSLGLMQHGKKLDYGL